MASKVQIGNALSNIREDILKEVRGLAEAYSNPDVPYPDDMVIQAVDTPSRARARVQEWISQYTARNGVGTGLVFLNECLTAAGSVETVASLNAQIAMLEAQAQIVVDGVTNSGWTMAEAATWLINNVPIEQDEEFSYKRLPIPPNYITVWGDTW